MKPRQKKASQTESFWPRFKRRIKYARNSKTYSEYDVEISPADDKPEALVKILSVSQRGDVIPVTILSTVQKPAATVDAGISVKSQKSAEISVKSQKSAEISATSQKSEEENAPTEKEEVTKADHRSWVRIVVRALGFSTNSKSRKGKVREDTPRGEEITVIDPPKIRAVRITLTHSTPGPVDEQKQNLSHNSGPLAASTPKATTIDLEKKAKPHGGASSSPKKSRRASAPPASISYTQLPAMAATLDNTLPGSINIHRLSVSSNGASSPIVLQSINSSTVKEEGFDVSVCASVLIIVLLCLVLSDKFFAIVCTTMWWCALPMLTSRMAKIDRPADSKRLQRRGKVTRNSLSNGDIDLQSSEYKKKVIMEGLLQRKNHRGA